MTDFRALCAELVDALAEWRLGGGPPEDTADADLIARARSLLAQPVAQPPADGEVAELVEWLRESLDCALQSGNSKSIKNHCRLLDLLGRPTPQPEGGDIHYAWELHDAEGDWQAGGSAITLESVRREGNHYLQTYSQDGPHTLFFYRASTIEEVTND